MQLQLEEFYNIRTNALVLKSSVSINLQKINLITINKQMELRMLNPVGDTMSLISINIQVNFFILTKEKRNVPLTMSLYSLNAYPSPTKEI